MGWNNPKIPWPEFERILSGWNGRDAGLSSDQEDVERRGPQPAPAPPNPTPPTRGDSAGGIYRSESGFPYAELHCHSNFSFLDGASSPEILAKQAAHLGLEALALTDHDGMYGAARFAVAAGEVGLRTIFGAELSFDLPKPQAGEPDPQGHHLLLLARDPEGYARLCRAISEGQLAGKEKGKPVYNLARLAELHGNHWLVLTGCRKGSVPKSLAEEGPESAARALADLVALFGRDNVAVELWDHGFPTDSHRNDALAELAAKAKLPLVATNNVHYATADDWQLANALAAVRARRSLDEIEGWLPPAPTARLRSGNEMARLFSRFPGVVEHSAELGLECTFDLALVAPKLPDFPLPEGHTEMSWLRQITLEGAARRYGPPDKERVPRAYKQIHYELDMIESLGFAGYFLIVWDIVQFCNRSNILCQGRGSAANSAVCYALGITNADAVALKLLFERFLSPERDGPPDIDLDIEADRREEAIQYVYEKHGRQHAAQVANVITYRPKSAVRDMAKAFGHSPGQQDAWSKQIDGWGPLANTPDNDVPQPVMDLAATLQGYPRHLGIHSGGMVMCDRPVIEVCPVEWARMENRTVLQWDKDDCAAAGLVKFDLLGLGMLTAIHLCIDLIAEHHGVPVDLATLPQEDAVYEMLSRADTVGVFQVESRAQMATLPRLRPRCFYDIVVEVALIRPGPIQGGSVHPYIRRRNGKEPVTYLHPLLENSLRKTLGVPLFQEQLMQMAVDVAGFTAAEADQLRQAMGSKRSQERMERLKTRLYEGMAERGITGQGADDIWEKLVAFSSFGFPESHSVSFAYLVYASAWLKHHYPAAFLAALLNAQPMGFWAPRTLVMDARRHGVEVLGPDINASSDKATLEGPREAPLVRVGIGYVRTIGEDVAKKIADGRPYKDMEDVARRCNLTVPHMEALATGGAFGCFDLSRREALWAAGVVARSREDQLENMVIGADPPRLPDMAPIEEASADFWSTGLSPDKSPMEFVRPALKRRGVLSAADLATAASASIVLVGGVVTHRQKPATAGGTIFINLEDETGLVNVICQAGVWARYRKVATTSPALVVTGRLEKAEGVINLLALKIEPLSLSLKTDLPSRDFR
ncbi:MAG: error-prone DNA polymerase [Actinomycetota bacterium]|nr:error-prone DNA polymerase [Actinomycetota bacterium]